MKAKVKKTNNKEITVKLNELVGSEVWLTLAIIDRAQIKPVGSVYGKLELHDGAWRIGNRIISEPSQVIGLLQFHGHWSIMVQA